MSLLDAEFKYTPAAQTDITHTWRRFGYTPTTEAERHARQRSERGRSRRPMLVPGPSRLRGDYTQAA